MVTLLAVLRENLEVLKAFFWGGLDEVGVWEMKSARVLTFERSCGDLRLDGLASGLPGKIAYF